MGERGKGGMKEYLLYKNAFFEILSFLVGKNVRRDEYDFNEIKEGRCYISKITEVEIISVIGKYARGEQEEWQRCDRIIAEDGTRCDKQYFHKGRKGWNKRLCKDMLKLVKEILDGSSTILKVEVLDLNEEVVHYAKEFIMYAFKHKFGSQDAFIAATAIAYSTEERSLQVVTSDKGLCAAMKKKGIPFVVPGNRINLE